MPDPGQAKALLLTGAPGIGKTTVVLRVAERLAGRCPDGFYTEEIREVGTRRGFRLVTLDGRERVIAHVDLPDEHRVSKYGVDVDAIGQIAAEVLTPAGSDAGLWIIDEIGKMECMSDRFVACVRAVLGSGTPVLGTVSRSGGGFMAEVRDRPDVLVWEVTLENRDALPRRVVAWYESATSADD